MSSSRRRHAGALGVRCRADRRGHGPCAPDPARRRLGVDRLPRGALGGHRVPRFFSAKPRLSAAEVEGAFHPRRPRRPGGVRRRAGRPDGRRRPLRPDGREREAEVAFVVADEHQGRESGPSCWSTWPRRPGSGDHRFVAETLPTTAGCSRCSRRPASTSGALRPDGGAGRAGDRADRTARAAIEEREHRAEARSVARCSRPRSVAVIGASRNPATVGHQVLRNLLAGASPGRSTRSTPARPTSPASRPTRRCSTSPTRSTWR